MSDMSGLAEALIGGDPERLFRLGEVEAVNPGPPRTLTVDGREMRYIGRASVTNTVVYVDEGNDPFVLGKLSDGDDGVPIGVPLPFLGAEAPSGYLLCDGRSTSGYPLLAEVVGANVPDLRSRVLVGAGLIGALGARGGAATVTLTTAQMPGHGHPMGSHDHTVGGNSVGHVHQAPNHDHPPGQHVHGTGIGGGHRHNMNLDYAFTFSHDHGNRSGSPAEGINTNRGGTATSTIAIHDVGGHGHGNTGAPSQSGVTGLGGAINTGGNSVTHTHDVGATALGTSGPVGSGGAHENMPPYQAVNYIIRAE